jgi:hypothetical protein
VANPPKIAAVVTEYSEDRHADVIVTKFLEGCHVLDVDFRPQVEVASLYIDQLPASGLGLEIAARHGVPVYPTIAEALGVGGSELAVDGVLLIGEHGEYPHNEIGQHLYPRRRFFAEAVEVMRRSGRVVPTFNDKHLGPVWADAKWMWETARELRMPFMAGSSVPVSWRRPDLHFAPGTDLREALMVGYSGVEIYGFHTLEALQCMVERRAGGETGVRSVRCLAGDAVWEAGEAGEWDWSLLEACLARSEKPAVSGATRDEVRERSEDVHVFLVEYADGFRAAALMLTGFCSEFLFAGRMGSGEIASTLFWLQDGKPHAHFARLCEQIQRMFLTGKPSYPVERTVLTTGVLDAGMHSRYQGGTRIETPDLLFSYAAE